MMNQNTTTRERGPVDFDFSHGSKNTYLVEARHRLIPTCIYCGRGSRVLFDGAEYYAYYMTDRFRTVAEAFPMLTSAQHEVLMTGIHPDCWEAIFADDEGGD